MLSSAKAQTAELRELIAPLQLAWRQIVSDSQLCLRENAPNIVSEPLQNRRLQLLHRGVALLVENVREQAKPACSQRQLGVPAFQLLHECFRLGEALTQPRGTRLFKARPQFDDFLFQIGLGGSGIVSRLLIAFDVLLIDISRLSFQIQSCIFNLFLQDVLFRKGVDQLRLPFLPLALHRRAIQLCLPRCNLGLEGVDLGVCRGLPFSGARELLVCRL
ncbi:putative GTP-binding domain protein [Burkholderia pseudomallei MSHR3709]|nr:putative GTP-binding domain protein [Burkholderia pseudomallei MSHR3709]